MHVCFDIKEIDKIQQTGNRIADEVKNYKFNNFAKHKEHFEMLMNQKLK